MKSLSPLTFFLTIATCVALSPSCQQAASPAASAAATGTGSATLPDTGPTVPPASTATTPSANTCTAVGTNTYTNAPFGNTNGISADPNNTLGNSGSTNPTTGISAGLMLTGYVTYNDNIMGLLQTNCTRCHGVNGQPNPPDLTTYAAAAQQAQASLTAIQNNSMPQAAPLQASDQATFQAWVAGGTLQAQPNSAGTVGNGTLGTNGTATDPCTGLPYGTGNTLPNTNGFPSSPNNATDTLAALLNPPQMAACTAQGKVYDRAGQTCGAANVATSFPCTDGGVRQKFLALGVSADAQLSLFEGEGYQIDQCGELNNDPIVYFVKSTNGGTTVSLQIKKLCRQSSTLCE